MDSEKVQRGRKKTKEVDRETARQREREKRERRLSVAQPGDLND